MDETTSEKFRQKDMERDEGGEEGKECQLVFVSCSNRGLEGLHSIPVSRIATITPRPSHVAAGQLNVSPKRAHDPSLLRHASAARCMCVR